jgi:acyl-CoA dehydrogenase
MDFALSAEQEMIVSTVRSFVETEIYPHEAEVERRGEVPPELAAELRRKVIDMGFWACNFPEEIGGGGLGHLDFALVERELGRGSMALTHFFGRPQNILMACAGDQRERYLLPAVRGERMDALAMTEPDAGSDVRGMKCTAVRDGNRSVSHRGNKYSILEFDDCRLPQGKVLGEVDGGFEVMNTWLYATRITVATMSVGRARRVFDLALRHAAERRQFGQPIAKFQGVSFQIADMITEIDAADWLTLAAAWRLDRGLPANREIASAKLYASEMLARVTDAALQIHGGMGLMDDLPIERFWRDARVERIWDGTSEIQRHIIGRELFRPLGA